MIYLDLALRGGAIALMALLALLLWQAPIGREGRLSVSAVALTEGAFLIDTAAMAIDHGPIAQGTLTVLASFSPAAVTWLIVTIFLDAPGRRWPWITASLVTSAAHYIDAVLWGTIPLCAAMAMLLFGGLVGLSLWSTRDDLVECRCHARPGFAIAIAGLALFSTTSESTTLLEAASGMLAILQSASTLIVTMVFAAWLLQPEASRWPGVVPPARATPDPAKAAFSDPSLIARIQAAMSADIWREEGLTIGALAERLAVPEHRLRSAINKGLGYRNFSSFINQARIKAACTTLSDPTQMNVSVLEVAYEVGFASVGPFNRAFRDATGQSPTEYRRASMASAFADSEKTSSISVNMH